MKREIGDCVFLIILGIMGIDVISSALKNPQVSPRLKRQEVIGQFKSVRCNRTIWKTIFEPYLNAERKLQQNPVQLDLNNEFDQIFQNLTQWKNAHLSSVANLFVVCGLKTSLECNEEGLCVCGTGHVPYSFQTSADSNKCYGKRGTNCFNEKDCVPGLTCQERYCGGSLAFFEESKKINEPGNNDAENDAQRVNSVNGELTIYSLFLFTFYSIIAV